MRSAFFSEKKRIIVYNFIHNHIIFQTQAAYCWSSSLVVYTNVSFYNLQTFSFKDKNVAFLVE